MTISTQIRDHLSANIAQTQLETTPFHHMVLNGPFPADLYPTLLSMLPANSYYRELKHSDAMMPDGHSARLQFPLNVANIARLPPSHRAFWNEVLDGMSDRKVEAAWRAKFKSAIEDVSGRAMSEIKFRPHYTLFRDLGGYKISIHPDSPRKAITTQYYLPEDESQLHLGTLFHDRNADGTYREARAMRFAPNSGYAFAVGPASYHSVKPMRADDRPRNSLMVIFNYDRGPLLEGFKAGRARVRAWYDRALGRNGTEEGEGRYEQM